MSETVDIISVYLVVCSKLYNESMTDESHCAEIRIIFRGGNAETRSLNRENLKVIELNFLATINTELAKKQVRYRLQ